MPMKMAGLAVAVIAALAVIGNVDAQGAKKPPGDKRPQPEPPKPAVIPDTVRLNDSSEVKGKVTRWDAKGLEIESGGKSRPILLEDISDVVLGDTPPSIRNAELALTSANAGQAISHFQEAMEEVNRRRARDLHKPAIYYGLAQAHAAMEDYDRALDTIRTLHRECGNSYRRADGFRLALNIGRRLREAGRRSNALDDILTDMKGEPEPLKGEAEMAMARLSYEKGNTDAAYAIFQRLAVSSQPYAANAKLWSLRCLRALKKTDDLERACTSVLAAKTSVSLALLQAAYAALAEIRFAKATTDQARGEAIQDGFRAVAIGPPPKDDTSEDYAAALLLVGRYVAERARAVESPESQHEYKNRAIGYFTEVSRYYRGTAWGKSAEQELVKLGATGKEATPETPKGGAAKPPLKGN